MMTNLLLFGLPHFPWLSASRVCLGLLAVLVVFGLMLNPLLDTDCFRLQPAACCCGADSTAQDIEIQVDTCTHCTGWLPLLLFDDQSEVSMVDLPFHSLIGRAYSVLHLERPPIFA